MEGNDSGLGLAKKTPRGSWAMAQKQQAVAESNVTGASVAVVAKRHGVRPALLSAWHRQLSPKVASPQKPARFAAVRVNATPFDGTIEIDLAGGCVRVRGIVDAVMLGELLAAARYRTADWCADLARRRRHGLAQRVRWVGSRRSFRSIPSRVSCLHFVAAVLIGLSCCGGMVTVCVCSRIG
jgi:hypothetical protein